MELINAIKMTDLNQIKKYRFLYLSELYKKSKGSPSSLVYVDDIENELGFDHNLASNIIEYLVNEKLIAWFGKSSSLNITHKGIKEVEQAYENPNQSTEHFAPIVNYNINITSGHGNVVNTGNNNTIKVSNSNKNNEIVKKAKEIISTLQEDKLIEKIIQEEAINTFTELIKEVEQAKPSMTTIDKIFMYGGSIGSIGSMAVGLIQLLTR
jgi:hypothetical protein